MFPLGHLGIGAKIVKPWSRNLPRPFLFLGTLLPDLIDKSLYYGLSFSSGTRTLAHTALFTLSFGILCWLNRSKALAALTLGMASHLLLDSLNETLEWGNNSNFLRVLLWPLLGWSFPEIGWKTLGEHLAFWHRPFILSAEIIGALLLLEEYLKLKKRRGEKG